MTKVLNDKTIIGIVIIVLMITASIIFQRREIILPEIAALVVGCLLYQNPIWVSRPLHIFLLPSITAVLGFLVNMLSIGLPQKLILVIVLMMVVLKIFKSSLAPTLATGLLPVITNASSYSFIISILLFTFLLALYLTLAYPEQKNDPLPQQINSKDGWF